MVRCWVWTWLDTVRHENIVIKIIHDSWLLIFLDTHRKALSEWHISFHVSYFLFIWCAICSTFWVLDVTVVVFIFLGLCAAAMSKSTTYRTIDQLTDLELVSCDKLCLGVWLGPTKKWLPKMLDVTTWCIHLNHNLSLSNVSVSDSVGDPVIFSSKNKIISHFFVNSVSARNERGPLKAILQRLCRCEEISIREFENKFGKTVWNRPCDRWTDWWSNDFAHIIHHQTEFRVTKTQSMMMMRLLLH